MQDGCKVYMDSYMALNGSCLMVTWTILKTHLLEVCLTQNEETMALRTLTTVDVFYFIMLEGHFRMNRNSLKQHLVESPVTYAFTLHLKIRDHTT